MGVVKLADYRHNPVQHQETSSMGHVSIHRQFMDSRLYKDSQAVHLWLHLILKANHESTVVNTDIGPITVDRGQMITGRRRWSEKHSSPTTKFGAYYGLLSRKGCLIFARWGRNLACLQSLNMTIFRQKLSNGCPTVVQRKHQ